MTHKTKPLTEEQFTIHVEILNISVIKTLHNTSNACCLVLNH